MIEAIGLTEALAVLIDEGASDAGELRAKRARGLSLKGMVGGVLTAAIMSFASGAGSEAGHEAVQHIPEAAQHVQEAVDAMASGLEEILSRE